MAGESGKTNGTDVKKLNEVVAGFLNDMFMNWRSDPPEGNFGRFMQYVVAWLGAFSFSYPAFMMNTRSIIEKYFEKSDVLNLTIVGLIATGVYSLLPAILVGVTAERQSSVRIYLAGFLLPYAIWALVGQFAPSVGGNS